MTTTDPRTRTWDRPADRVRDNLDRRVQRHRDNTSLNAEARDAFIAEEYLSAKRQMDEISKATAADRAQKVAAAKRRVFGVDDILGSAASATDRATAAISYRDATDRASKLSNQAEAQEMLDSAERSGDDILARAVAAWAVDRGVQSVADRYFDTRPQQSQALGEYMNALQPTKGGAADLFEFVLPTPSEVAHSLYNPEALAAQADTYRQAIDAG
jgi:hypothetical protein